ncbi:MAG: DoxX family protein [Saprospiraceae bacterium]
MKDLADLIGRILVSIIFLVEAYDSLTYSQQTKNTMAEYGITWQPDLLLVGSIFVLALGGILILIGYRSSFGALLLLLYWVPVTFIVHSFWNDPAELQRQESIAFMKNIAIMGGVIIIWVNGSGRYSVKRLFATARVPRKDR